MPENKTRFKLYLDGEGYSKCKLDNDQMAILNIHCSSNHIDLADYIELEQTISWSHSFDWEYDIHNNSDRVVRIQVEMNTEDSGGRRSSEQWDEYVQPNQILTCYIESAYSMISTCSIELTATAEDADTYHYSKYNR